MNWDFQLAVVVGIIGLALAGVARSIWRTLAGKKTGCATSCSNCAAPEPPQPKGRISLPQV
jgi:hypothetical protein